MMKIVFLLLTILVSAEIYGQLLDAPAPVKAPAPLTDSTIERTLENGKVQKFDGNEWMIVKRKPKMPKAAAPTPVPTPSPQIVEKTVTVEKTVFVDKVHYNKNRISLMGGEGPRYGVDSSYDGHTLEMRSRVGVIGGAEYQYSFTEHWHAGIQVQTNNSCLVGGGYSW